MSSSASSSSSNIDSRLFDFSDDESSSIASDDGLFRDHDETKASVAVVVTVGISTCVLSVFPFYGVISIGLAFFTLMWIDVHSRALTRGPSIYFAARSLLITNTVIGNRPRRDSVAWIPMDQMEKKLQQDHRRRQLEMEQRQRLLDNSQYADMQKTNSGEKASAEAIRSPKELMK